MVRLQGGLRVEGIQGGTRTEVWARLAKQRVDRLKAALMAGVGGQGLRVRRLREHDHVLPLIKLINSLFEKIGDRAIDLRCELLKCIESLFLLVCVDQVEGRLKFFVAASLRGKAEQVLVHGLALGELALLSPHHFHETRVRHQHRLK